MALGTSHAGAHKQKSHHHHPLQANNVVQNQPNVDVVMVKQDQELIPLFLQTLIPTVSYQLISHQRPSLSL